MRQRSRIAVWVLALGLGGAVISVEYNALLAVAPLDPQMTEHIPASVSASPPVRVCGNNTILGGGPSSAPLGSISVPPGDNADVNLSMAKTTYWFAPGIHTLGRGVYNQIIPGPGSSYIGAPGATIDGQHLNNTAFGGNVVDVTVKYLTIQDFSTPGNQGAVNASAAANWKIEYNTIQDIVPGTAIYAGTNNIVQYNCLTENGQSGFGTYTVHDTSSLTQGARNIVISHNELTRNDTCNWEALPKWPGPAPPRGCLGVPTDPGCGCSGGGKFWQTEGGEFEDNYVHDNYSVGVWWDSNNTGFDIEGNYISGNYSYGLIYEISYNAQIRHNIFLHNGLVAGPLNPGLPTSAIYISESGSDARVRGKYQNRLSITENVFNDNWSGIVLWENSNRFCNSPANTSGGDCTLVNPGVVNIASCNRSDIYRSPYYDDCRWKTQNVLIDNNIFYFWPTDIGPSCTIVNRCGFQGIFSEWGTYPSWSPYKGTIVEKHLTFDQNNQFSSNTYIGPWQFVIYDQGNVVDWTDWQAPPYSQDTGSTFQPDLASQGQG